MVNKNIRSKTFRASLIFRNLGFMSLVVQWMWSMLIAVYPLIISGQLDYPSDTSSNTVDINLAPEVTSSPLAVILAVTITVIVLIATIIFLARLPRKIGQAGEKLTINTVNVVLPVALKGEKTSRKKKIELTMRLEILIKTIFVIAPLGLLSIVENSTGLQDYIIQIIAIFLMSVTFLLFCVEYGLRLLDHGRKKSSNKA